MIRSAARLFLVTALSAAWTGCGTGTGTSCLAAGTLVTTPTGQVPIEHIAVGSPIYAVDPRSGRRLETTVTAVRTASRTCLRVTTSQGRTITATGDHPFYNPRTSRYVPLAELLQGREAILATHDGSWAQDEVAAWHAETAPRVVYDLSVSSPLHNFLAGGALVHNKSRPNDPLPDIPYIAEYVSVRAVATGRDAVASQLPLPPLLGAPPAAVATRGTFTGGVGLVQLTHSVPFDRVLILGEFTAGEPVHPSGYLELVLDTPTSSLDLRVTLTGGASEGTLQLVPEGAGVPKEPAVITVPSEG